MYNASDNRYKIMNYRRSGASGLLLPEVSLGCWHNFGINNEYDNMKDMCFTAFDNGITHFDLANNYGPEPGRAEINVGRIIKEEMYNYRDELIISSKAGYDMWEGPYGNWGSKKYLIASANQSLKRLGVEYFDIFYHHRIDPNTPLEETMMALDTIVKSGKALYAGISNYDRENMIKASEILKSLNCPFVINQVRYSMLDRHIEEDGLIEAANEIGCGLIAFSPLEQGLLTNRYLNGIPNDSRIKTDGRFLNETSLTKEKIAIIKALNEVAQNRGQSLAQMALSWVLKDKGVTSVIIGASRKEQILDNLKIVNKTDFTNNEIEIINNILKNQVFN